MVQREVFMGQMPFLLPTSSNTPGFTFSGSTVTAEGSCPSLHFALATGQWLGPPERLCNIIGLFVCLLLC